MAIPHCFVLKINPDPRPHLSAMNLIGYNFNFQVVYLCAEVLIRCVNIWERGCGCVCTTYVTCTTYHAYLFFLVLLIMKSAWFLRNPPPHFLPVSQYLLESFESFWKISCNFWIFSETFEYFLKLFWILPETFCILYGTWYSSNFWTFSGTFEYFLELYFLKLFEYFLKLGEYFLKLFKYFLEPFGTFWLLPGTFWIVPVTFWIFLGTKFPGSLNLLPGTLWKSPGT